jgi:hypothetical protein
MSSTHTTTGAGFREKIRHVLFVWACYFEFPVQFIPCGSAVPQECLAQLFERVVSRGVDGVLDLMRRLAESRRAEIAGRSLQIMGLPQRFLVLALSNVVPDQIDLSRRVPDEGFDNPAERVLRDHGLKGGEHPRIDGGTWASRTGVCRIGMVIRQGAFEPESILREAVGRARHRGSFPQKATPCPGRCTQNAKGHNCVIHQDPSERPV